MVLDAKTKLTKARIALISQHPFFGSLALRLIPTPATHITDPATGQSTSMPTLATDGRLLLYNPNYLDRLSQEQIMGCVAHEVMHAAMGHPYRRAARDPMKWNVGADVAINPLVKAAGLALPDGALYPKMFGLPDDKHAEEYYALLPDAQACTVYVMGNGDGSGNGNATGCGCSGVLDATDPVSGGKASAAEASLQAAEWQVAVRQAAAAAKAAGNLPGGLERYIGEQDKPQVDWRAVLRRFITAYARDDFRWTPPNRRFVGQGIYLPSMRSERVGTIVLAVDTSGSIGEAELNAFSAELNAILEDARPEMVHVLSCDTAVQADEEYTAEDYPVRLNASGGGGTRFQPVFDYVEENDIRPQALVYLTDMYPFDHPTEPEGYAVLWVSTTEGRVGEFGETVFLKV